MTQSEVRQSFIRSNPGVKRIGLQGYWYKCAHCGKWCARPGKSGVKIPDHMKMEVDHIKPWSKGGSDEIWNLQPLCKPCNRNKSNNTSVSDDVKMIINDVIHADIIGSTIKKELRNNKILKGLGITKRK